ncbi:MAG: type II toxin-antitoxin system HicA family toxin [Acidobacteria bacterium]|nr:MAG: type II toxin-antitoxin system HicA family toxin [Acidobacteriota bacterium]
MPKLRVLSGAQAVKFLASFGFEVVRQRGSHMKLRWILTDGASQTLTLPSHRELDQGTLLQFTGKPFAT